MLFNATVSAVTDKEKEKERKKQRDKRKAETKTDLPQENADTREDAASGIVGEPPAQPLSACGRQRRGGAEAPRREQPQRRAVRARRRNEISGPVLLSFARLLRQSAAALTVSHEEDAHFSLGHAGGGEREARGKRRRRERGAAKGNKRTRGQKI